MSERRISYATASKPRARLPHSAVIEFATEVLLLALSLANHESGAQADLDPARRRIADLDAEEDNL